MGEMEHVKNLKNQKQQKKGENEGENVWGKAGGDKETGCTIYHWYWWWEWIVFGLTSNSDYSNTIKTIVVPVGVEK